MEVWGGGVGCRVCGVGVGWRCGWMCRVWGGGVGCRVWAIVVGVFMGCRNGV